jgi:hypothetical protein
VIKKQAGKTAFSHGSDDDGEVASCWWRTPALNRKDAPGGPDAAAIATLSQHVAQVLRASGLAVGMFYTGFGGGPLTDTRWMTQAREHMDAVERSGINPDHIIVTSWDKFPATTLPENDPDALSNLVAYYVDRYRR